MIRDAGVSGGEIGYDYYDNHGEWTSFQSKGLDFELMAIYLDIDTMGAIYEIEVEKLGLKKQLRIPEKDAKQNKGILAYADQGLDVNSSNASLVVEVFAYKEKEYFESGKEIRRFYTRPGVRNDSDESEDESRVYCGASNPLTNDSYEGNLALQPSGKADEYLQFLKDEIRGHPSLEFAVMAGLSGVINGYLMAEGKNQNFIIHLVGDSSTGKTTAAKLAISTLGNPEIDADGGLFQSWGATENYILSYMQQVSGITFGLDELSMCNKRDLTNLVYALANGSDKGRLNNAAKIQDRMKGTYVIVSTGESGLLSKCNDNIGLSMRVLEFRSIEWTDSAEQSERIQDFVSGNYGHLGTMFGLELTERMRNGELNFLDKYEYWRAYYIKQCSIEERKERISARYAMILMAGDLLNEFFHLDFDVKAVCQFIIDNENQHSDKRNDYNGLYDSLVSLIQSRDSHFDKKINGKWVKASGESWGRFVSLKKESITINGEYASKKAEIRQNILQRELKKLGIEDAQTVLQYLKRHGYLDCDSDRLTRARIYDKVRELVYVLYLPSGKGADTAEE